MTPDHTVRRAVDSSEEDPLFEYDWGNRVVPARPAGPSQKVTKPHASEDDQVGGGQNMRFARTAKALGELNGKKIFHDSLALQADYRYNGRSDGDKWRGKTRRMIISAIPAAYDILPWAERLEQVPKNGISDQMVVDEFSGLITKENVVAISAALWGFLNNCVTEDAEQEFKRAGMMSGIEAWRRLSKTIDNGKAVKLERIRVELRKITQKPMKSIDQISAGITKYENKVQELVDAGGTESQPEEQIADIKAILPKEVRDGLVWWMSNHIEDDFAKFRDTLNMQVAKVLLGRGEASVHNIEGHDHEDGDEDQALANAVAEHRNDAEGMLAAITKIVHNRGGANGRMRDGRDPRMRQSDPTKQRCGNCGETGHHGGQCTKPKIPWDKRP